MSIAMNDQNVKNSGSTDLMFVTDHIKRYGQPML